MRGRNSLSKFILPNSKDHLKIFKDKNNKNSGVMRGRFKRYSDCEELLIVSKKQISSFGTPEQSLARAKEERVDERSGISLIGATEGQ